MVVTKMFFQLFWNSFSLILLSWLRKKVKGENKEK